MSPDWFPLEPGLELLYERRGDGEERAELLIELLSVSRRGDELSAKGRRTLSGPGRPPRRGEFVVERRADGMYLDGGLLFPLPPVPGREWDARPDRLFVESLDAEIAVPAGRFAGCLKVGLLIAGGDAGSGERFYAPGVGLVRSYYGDEASPYELSLLSHRRKG